MGFAQEMKDFVGSYQATYDTGIKGRAQRTSEKALEADTTYKNANLDLAKQELALKKQQVANSAALKGYVSPKDQKYIDSLEARIAESEARTKLYNAQTDALTAKTTDATNQTEGASVAATVPDTVVTDSEDFPEPAARPGTVDASANYRGGMIAKQYADTGAPVVAIDPNAGPRIGKDPNAPTLAALPTPAPAQALPITPAIPPKTQPIPAATKAPEGTATSINLEPAKKALGTVAEKFVYDATKPTAALGPGSEGGAQSAQNNVTGMEKLPLSQFDVLGKTVDPDGKMTERQRNAAILGAAFETQKDPTAQFKLSYGVLSSLKEQSQILGNLIPDALRAGHQNEVCRLFNDACAKYPVGHEITLSPIPQGFTWTVKDEAGKVVDSGNLTPDQLLQETGAIRDGSAFNQQVYDFYKQNKATGGSYDKALDLVSDASKTRAQAAAAYDAAKKNPDSTNEQIQAAYDAYKKADEAVPTSGADADRLGKMGVKPRTEAQIKADKRAAEAIPTGSVEAPPTKKPVYTTPEESLSSISNLSTAAKTFGKAVTKLSDYTYDPASPEPPTDPEAYLKSYKAAMAAQQALTDSEDKAKKSLLGANWGNTSPASRPAAISSQLAAAKGKLGELPELPDAKGVDPSELVPDMVYMVNGTPMIWRVTDNGSGFQK
jgi:hypothetical protein